MLPSPFIFRIFWVMESLSCCPGMCPWLLEVPQRADNWDGPSITWLWSGRTRQSTSRPGKRQQVGSQSLVLTKLCWSHQLGEPQLCEPVFLCRGGTAMLCVPRQGPWHKSTSFGSPVLSYVSVGSFLPNPSLIACFWTLATVCCSQCLWYSCLQNCEMSWVKDQQGQLGF